MQITISKFDNKTDVTPKPSVINRGEFTARIKTPHIRQQKDGALFAPAVFDPPKRLKENVIENSMFVVDIDAQITLADLCAKIAPLGCAFDIYSTHSHNRVTDKNPHGESRWRLCIWLAENVPANEYETLWQAVNSYLELNADPQARDVSRMHYVPVKADNSSAYEFFISPNENPFDWKMFLAELPKTESVAPENTSAKKEFECHEERNDFLKQLIRERGQKTRAGFQMKCPAHSGTGNTSLFSPNDSGAVKCLKGCDYFSILSAFGLSGESLPSKTNPKVSTNVGNDQGDKTPELSKLPVLSNVALFGLAGDIVRTIAPHTEADNAALLIQLLAAFGNVIGKTAYFVAEADFHYLKINACLIGVSSKGRKGTSWGQIKRIVERAEDSFINCVQDGLSSGEGLIYHVRDAQEKETPIKEKGRIVGYQTEIFDPGAIEKRAFILEPEFARVLRVMQREGNTLSSVIRQAWDSDRLRVMTKTPLKATNAHISIIGHITQDELRRNLDETETANGFANRFLWLFTKRSKFLPEGGNLNESDLNSFISSLAEALNFAKQQTEIKFDEQARLLWFDVYEKLSTGANGLLGSVTSRAEAQTKRLACIYALLDLSSVIRLEHLNSALALWQYCEDSARYVFGETTGDKTSDEIINALAANSDGLDRTQISKLFSGNRTASQIKNSLQALLESGRINRVEEKTAGRPRELFFTSSYEINEINEISLESTIYTSEKENKLRNKSEGFSNLEYEINELNELSPETSECYENVNSFNSFISYRNVEKQSTSDVSFDEPTAPKTYDCPNRECAGQIPTDEDICPKCEKRAFDF